jgi:ADP-ribosylglycohydrolase
VPVRVDRAAGVVVASAAADALGAPHEFRPPVPEDRRLKMSGGGSFNWAPGEWTDDTQQALAVLAPLADGVTALDDLVVRVEEGLLAWFESRPRDVGNQTRSVMSTTQRSGGGLAAAAAGHLQHNADSAGNGSLMRTGPVGLYRANEDQVAELARAVSSLTHAHSDCLDACVLWSTAIHRLLDRSGDVPDWVSVVEEGLVHLPADRRSRWANLLAECRTRPAAGFDKNGWVVHALQAALAAIAQTPAPSDGPRCGHLRLAIETAVRVGGDTDTVAAISGALVGAWWGATAVPWEWRRPLHGRRTYDQPPQRLATLDAEARLALWGGQPDRNGWPGVPSMLPHYGAQHGPNTALCVQLTDQVLIGGARALPQVAAEVDAVVSLCRMGTHDVPDCLEHLVVGLLDSSPEENPNLEFVVTDTADLVGALVDDGMRVFLHCVRAESRTPAVAATYLIRHDGMSPREALRRVHTLIGGPVQPFLVRAVQASQFRQHDGAA